MHEESNAEQTPNTSVEPALPLAAAVYTPHARDIQALPRFVEALKAQGVRIGGILQEDVLRPDGSRSHIDAVDQLSGQRFPINQPKPEKRETKECSLDAAVLTDSTSAVRAAVAESVDLVVIEKFGAEEQRGGGLADEMLEVVAAEIPLLVAVPENGLEAWDERMGGMGTRIPFEEAAFHAWWESAR